MCMDTIATGSSVGSMQEGARPGLSPGSLAASTLYAGMRSWPSFLVGQVGNPVRVLIVDSDAHMRALIAQELLADGRTSLVAQASGFAQACQAMRQHAFDVLLVDMHLADGEGLALIDEMQLLRPAAQAVALSFMDSDELALRALERGAAGYLVKHSWFGSYPQAVLQVANGGAAITPNVERRLLQRLVKPSAPSPQRSAPVEAQRLSPRELEVLRLVAAGRSSVEIGEHLGISSMTVNTHIKNIYRKLQVRTRAQAVRWASLNQLF